MHEERDTYVQKIYVCVLFCNCTKYLQSCKVTRLDNRENALYIYYIKMSKKDDLSLQANIFGTNKHLAREN